MASRTLKTSKKTPKATSKTKSRGRRVRPARSRTAEGEGSARERILETAAELIHARGFVATSVDDILAASGTGKGQFYYYFEGKEALIREVIRLQARRVGEWRAKIGPLDNLAAMEAWLRFFVRWMAARACLRACPIGSIAGEMGEADVGVRDEIGWVVGVWRTRLVAGFQAMRRSGELPRSVKAASLADYVLSGIQGGLLVSKASGSVQPIRSVTEQIIDHLRRLARKA